MAQADGASRKDDSSFGSSLQYIYNTVTLAGAGGRNDGLTWNAWIEIKLSDQVLIDYCAPKLL
ncbi:hypothetical protein FNU79_18110 [Deinococcus detaillensis]|uniref:Uncharacterized protein n=1 Tax=Deinococcus detaillensis TaxID=2592048 RepID=A0A553UGG0_9DEIO|nr:hypothetical protein [Deinococcus detaillensis]TSA79297.1 hypothetical protein FNU79_18110 [Deinococcus detaillensis]